MSAAPQQEGLNVPEDLLSYDMIGRLVLDSAYRASADQLRNKTLTVDDVAEVPFIMRVRFAKPEEMAPEPQVCCTCIITWDGRVFCKGSCCGQRR